MTAPPASSGRPTRKPIQVQTPAPVAVGGEDERKRLGGRTPDREGKGRLRLLPAVCLVAQAQGVVASARERQRRLVHPGRRAFFETRRDRFRPARAAELGEHPGVLDRHLGQVEQPDRERERRASPRGGRRGGDRAQDQRGVREGTSAERQKDGNERLTRRVL